MCGGVCGTEQRLPAVLAHLPRPACWPPEPAQGKRSLGLLTAVIINLYITYYIRVQNIVRYDIKYYLHHEIEL